MNYKHKRRNFSLENRRLYLFNYNKIRLKKKKKTYGYSSEPKKNRKYSYFIEKVPVSFSRIEKCGFQ